MELRPELRLVLDIDFLQDLSISSEQQIIHLEGKTTLISGIPEKISPLPRGQKCGNSQGKLEIIANFQSFLG